jgi:hypothetical protein
MFLCQYSAVGYSFSGCWPCRWSRLYCSSGSVLCMYMMPFPRNRIHLSKRLCGVWSSYCRKVSNAKVQENSYFAEYYSINFFLLTAYWVQWCREWCNKGVEWFCCWWTTNEGPGFYKQSTSETWDGRPRTMLQVQGMIIAWFVSYVDSFWIVLIHFMICTFNI